MKGARLNLGCGRTPTEGWVNFDNSPTVRIARSSLYPLLARFLNDEQRAFAHVARERDVRWADVAKRIPMPDARAAAIYSSHMLEHLTKEAAHSFLAEARRVLAPGGILRLVVPDLQKLAADYAKDGDADRFVNRTLLSDSPRGARGALQTLLFGSRHHAWMYDGKSLIKLLGECGYIDARVVPAGITSIPEPGALDLRERDDESVYVEATVG